MCTSIILRLRHKQNNHGLELDVNLKIRQVMYVQTQWCVRLTIVEVKEE